MFKKVISLSLALAFLVTVIAGCGQQSNTSTSSTAAQTSTVEKKAEGTKKEPVVLKFYQSALNMPEAYDQLNKKFMKDNPDIKLEVEPTPNGEEWIQAIKTKFATGEAPDIFNNWTNYTEGFMKANMLKDLTNKPYIKLINDGANKQFTFDGKIWGASLGVVYTGMYYNTDIFSKLGLTVPKTWTEFLNVCETLKKNGYIPMSLPFKELWAINLLMYPYSNSLVFTNYPNFASDVKEGKDAYNKNPKWREVYEKIKLLETKGYFEKDATGVSLDQGYALFAQGKAAMMPQGTWAIPAVRKLNPDLKFSIFCSPASDKPEEYMGTALVEMGYSVAKDTKVEEAVDRYMEWAFKPENYNIFIQGDKGISILKEGKFEMDSAINEVFPLIQAGKVLPYYGVIPGLNMKEFAHAQMLFMGQTNLDQCMNNVQKDFDALLKVYKSK